MEMGKHPTRARRPAPSPAAVGVVLTRPDLIVLCCRGACRHPDRGADGLNGRGAAARSQEVGGVGSALKSDQVGAEQALHDLPPPWQLRKDLVSREGNVVKEPDP